VCRPGRTTGDIRPSLGRSPSSRAAQQERERIPLLGCQRRGGIDEPLDVGIQVCVLVQMRWRAAVTRPRSRAGTRPACHPGFGFRLRC